MAVNESSGEERKKRLDSYVSIKQKTVLAHRLKYGPRLVIVPKFIEKVDPKIFDSMSSNDVNASLPDVIEYANKLDIHPEAAAMFLKVLLEMKEKQYIESLQAAKNFFPRHKNFLQNMYAKGNPLLKSPKENLLYVLQELYPNMLLKVKQTRASTSKKIIMALLKNVPPPQRLHHFCAAIKTTELAREAHKAALQYVLTFDQKSQSEKIHDRNAMVSKYENLPVNEFKERIFKEDITSLTDYSAMATLVFMASKPSKVADDYVAYLYKKMVKQKQPPNVIEPNAPSKVSVETLVRNTLLSLVDTNAIEEISTEIIPIKDLAQFKRETMDKLSQYYTQKRNRILMRFPQEFCTVPLPILQNGNQYAALVQDVVQSRPNLRKNPRKTQALRSIQNATSVPRLKTILATIRKGYENTNGQNFRTMIENSYRQRRSELETLENQEKKSEREQQESAKRLRNMIKRIKTASTFKNLKVIYETSQGFKNFANTTSNVGQKLTSELFKETARSDHEVLHNEFQTKYIRLVKEQLNEIVSEQTTTQKLFKVYVDASSTLQKETSPNTINDVENLLTWLQRTIANKYKNDLEGVLETKRTPDEIEQTFQKANEDLRATHDQVSTQQPSVSANTSVDALLDELLDVVSQAKRSFFKKDTNRKIEAEVSKDDENANALKKALVEIYTTQTNLLDKLYGTNNETTNATAKKQLLKNMRATMRSHTRPQRKNTPPKRSAKAGASKTS